MGESEFTDDDVGLLAGRFVFGKWGVGDDRVGGGAARG